MAPIWKILIGRTLANYYANDPPEDSIVVAIQKHVAEGWVLKGDMLQVSKGSDRWMQRIVKPAAGAPKID